MRSTFHIFTDGSVIGNPGSGGWAAVLMSGDKTWEMSGSSPWTTISEMELLAAVEALHSIPAGSSVQLCSDSELLISGMLFHIRHWQANKWRNSRGAPLQHQDLWRELLAMNDRLNIQWQWIRGHSRHSLQTRADALAYRAARTQGCGLQRPHNTTRRHGAQAVLPASQAIGDTAMSEANTLFEIDWELDSLLDQIEEEAEENGTASPELLERFQQFCQAESDKVDRIGRFLRRMEAREQFCRSESARLSERAHAAASKVERTKNMVLYYLLSRDLKTIEGREFTLRAQKNSQDSVRITDEAVLPLCYRRIEAQIPGVIWETVLSILPEELAKTLEGSVQEARPDNDAIKAARAQNEMVPGTDVRRGTHLRIA